MIRIKNLAAGRPTPFALIATLLWIIIAGFFIIFLTTILVHPFLTPAVQSLGTLASSLIFVLIAALWRWLKPSGIARFGNWKTWLIILFLALYLVIVYTWAFFGPITFNFGALSSSGAQKIFFRQAIVAVGEETFFRGFILYLFSRVWAGSKQGLLWSLVLSALIFGSLHIFQLAAGQPLPVVLAAAFNSFISGILYGAIVIISGSIWPGVLLHMTSNSAAQIPALAVTAAAGSPDPYLFATLFELPIMLVALWLALRTSPRPVVPFVP